jgi:hypothetical protein
MSAGAKISGKKLVIVGSHVLIGVALSVRIFAGFYLRDEERSLPVTQPATMPVDPTPL